MNRARRIFDSTLRNGNLAGLVVLLFLLTGYLFGIGKVTVTEFLSVEAWIKAAGHFINRL